MTAMLDVGALDGVISMRETIDLLEQALPHENTAMSPKHVTNFANGSIRILFAADNDAGYCAMKAYHNIKDVGTRYVVLLYRLSDGELVATLDGRVITDLRTGAVSGVIARKVPVEGPVTVGIIGSGNQARTQLESLATAYRVEAAYVYSPTPANRAAFAAEMSARLGIPVTAVDSVESAARGRKVVATASNSRSADPILRGEWLEGCRLLCAVGNTRPNFAEIDTRCFKDAGLVVVDTPHAVEEAGDLRAATAADVLPKSKVATLAQMVKGEIRAPARGLVVFKSVGTALQDLALASRYYELLKDRPGTMHGPDVASLRDPARRNPHAPR